MARISGAIATFLGDVLASITGGLLGAKIADGKNKSGSGSLSPETQEEIRKEAWRLIAPDREDIMKALLRLGDKTRALEELINRANHDRFILINGKRYTEEWIIRMLLKVEAKDRDWVFENLNDLCESSREQLFATLEIMNNNGYSQWLRIVGVNLQNLGRTMSDGVKRGATAIDDAAAPELRALADLLERQPGARGSAFRKPKRKKTFKSLLGL